MTEPLVPKFLESAFNAGFNYSGESNNNYRFYCWEMGDLQISDGKIVACDPFLYNHDLPFASTFPIGSFPVQLAIAQIDDDERVAFSRIKFSNEIPCRWTLAVCDGQDPAMLNEDDILGYPVDAGTGAFMDTAGGSELHSFLTERDDNYEILIDEMEKNYKHTWDWLLWTKNGASVAMFKSGWGDGVYATYIGFDQSGNICRLVTDFEVIE
jgi:hypothetical protein